MKKIFLLLTLLLCTSMDWAHATQVEVDGIYYNLDSGSGTAEVSPPAYGQIYWGNISIPENVIYGGATYTVTSISQMAFTFCRGLGTITIPKSVTSIGNGAFAQCPLVSIIVDEGNTHYDSRNNCNALIETSSNTLLKGSNNTVIPNSVTSIADNAFYNSDLTSIEIPNSVTSIGGRAFYQCTGLTSVTIGNSVTSIGDAAFY